MSGETPKIQFAPPFLAAAFSVISTVLEDLPRRVDPSTASIEDKQRVNVLVGVVGTAEGHVIFSMPQDAADNIASTMIGCRIESFDQLAASAVGELCNMICGTALLQLGEAGFVCDVAPPSVVCGGRFEYAANDTPATVIPLLLALGEFEMTVALKEKERNEVAA